MDNTPCLEPLFPRRHIQSLQTPLGMRTLYDSVCYCNRCGGCAQVCPTYQQFHQETFSPRGRNQILRLSLEGKIKLNKKDRLLKQALISCTLCGRCTQTCAGQIPTAEHVLEMRRALHLRTWPLLLHHFAQLRDNWPHVFSVLTRSALFLRRLGLVKLIRLLQITKLPGLQWLNHADDILPTKIVSLSASFAKAGITIGSDKPELIYLPSFEAEFILPDIACETLRLAQQKGRTAVWLNTPSGLFAYLHTDLRHCRRVVRRLLTKYAATGNGKLPLITDSLDVYLFLKRVPQLFSGKKIWEKRAQQLANCVRFVSDLISPHPSDGKTPSKTTRVQLEYGTLFERQGPVFTQTEQIISTLFGKNFVECLYTDADTPAFGYGFSVPKSAEYIGLKTVEKIARVQTQKVVALSGLTVLELNFWLKKFYPTAEATHLVHVNR